jgi:hypothetical protein
MNSKWQRIWFAQGVVGLLLLTNSGCLGGLIVAGVAGAAAGGATGYAYVRGEVYRDYPVDPVRAEAAVRATLAEMQFQEVRRERDGAKISIETHTPNNTTVMVYVIPRDKQVNADPNVTRIAVRVGVFGDEELSVRILNTNDKYLLPPGAPVIQPTVFNQVPTAAPVETAVPPLASSGQPVPVIRK